MRSGEYQSATLNIWVNLEESGMYSGENGVWRCREKWRVRSEGFSGLQVPEEGCFRRSLSFPSRITPSIPADKLQVQHFLLCMPSCEHSVMVAVDLSFWVRILFKLRVQIFNTHTPANRSALSRILTTTLQGQH